MVWTWCGTKVSVVDLKYAIGVAALTESTNCECREIQGSGANHTPEMRGGQNSKDYGSQNGGWERRVEAVQLEVERLMVWSRSSSTFHLPD